MENKRFEIKNLDNITSQEYRESVLAYINNFKIEDEETYNIVKETLIAIKDEEKRLVEPYTTAKKIAHEPYKAAVAAEKEVKEFFKVISDAVSKNVITPYVLEQEKQKKEEQERLAQEHAKQLEERVKMLEEDSTFNVDDLEPIAAPKVSLDTIDTKGLRKTTSYDVEIENLDLVPKEYLTIEIKKALVIEAHKAGTTIPGLKIVENVKIG